ncbi:hypothetical protein Bca52824_078768 [Brassica carinata]|uniref:Uncharacterized protein n=1 Tax=Brassica carinata TaxID=52824 RepID=A0A8X7PW42_BRACI|nr:hypothetical protein Bca52824_078768 [Brassica carinata]
MRLGGYSGSDKIFTMKLLSLKVSRDILSFFEIHGGKRYDLLKERKSVEKHAVTVQGDLTAVQHQRLWTNTGFREL